MWHDRSFDQILSVASSLYFVVKTRAGFVWVRQDISTLGQELFGCGLNLSGLG
jgi:hypothetical protein